MLGGGLFSLPCFADDVVAPAAHGSPDATARRQRTPHVPALGGSLISLRDLDASDARALFEALTTDDVARFIAAPPSTIRGFEQFIAWTHLQQDAGVHVGFAVVPRGSQAPIGIFQVRSLTPAFETAEWGFAIASEFWGTGVFGDAANLVVAHAFQALGVRRLEARAATANGRGNGALEKIGAVREAVMRQTFPRRGTHYDQALWTILAEDWTPRSRDLIGPKLH